MYTHLRVLLYTYLSVHTILLHSTEQKTVYYDICSIVFPFDLPTQNVTYTHIPYSGKVWRGESLANLANRQQFAKLKPSKLVVIIITLWLYLSICQTLPCQTLKKSKFTKVLPRQTFPLYGKS